MIRINLNIKIEKPKWLSKILKCKHEVVSVEENFDSRYGTHTSYIMCLKCGRKAMEVERTCKHEEDCFGSCRYCRTRLSKENCKHKIMNKEPDTDESWCDNCGTWNDEI